MDKAGCNICLSKDSFLLDFKKGYVYSICKSCGHVFQNYRKDIEHYDNLPYESQWFDYANHCRRRAYYIIDFCFFNILKSKSILDIGSGPGGVLQELKNKLGNKIKYSGITSPQDKTLAIDGLELIFGDFNDVKIKEKYDFAILAHVLEHFIDPSKALKKINSILEPDGFLYVEVPSFTWGEVRSDSIFCPVHLSYFTKHQLESLLRRNGFEIVKIKESRHWGNIKVLAKKTEVAQEDVLKENWILKLVLWNLRKNLIFPYYRLLKKFKTIKPNE